MSPVNSSEWLTPSTRSTQLSALRSATAPLPPPAGCRKVNVTPSTSQASPRWHRNISCGKAGCAAASGHSRASRRTNAATSNDA
ncbi:hypothetical protein G6F57_022948 [Rhizopus arrhizus]|nr:hypothetical protein G6F57_022948 [Rhizopus arrhizus]